MTKPNRRSPRRSPARQVGEQPADLIEVAITAKQLKMCREVEAQASAAIQQRQTVLNTIAAAADFDGVCDFRGFKELPDGSGMLLLVPLKVKQPETPAKE